MLYEIELAAAFLCQYLTQHLPATQLSLFQKALESILTEKYSKSWSVAHPLTGSAFRAINVIDAKVDQVIILAATKAGFALDASHFPPMLVLWIDPHSVSYRVGDYGYGKVIYNNPGHPTQTPSPPAPAPVSNSSNSPPLSFKERVRATVIAY